MKNYNKCPTSPFVVAIDACLGREKSIGQIIVQHGPLLPGKAVNKELPPIGDISIKGVVNVGGFMEMLVLQNTRLHVTYSMSNKIARALLLAYQRHLLKRKHDYNYSNTTTIPGSKLATRILVNPAIFKPIANIITPPVAVISWIKRFNCFFRDIFANQS